MRVEIGDAAANKEANLLLLHIAKLLEAVLEEVGRVLGPLNTCRRYSHFLFFKLSAPSLLFLVRVEDKGKTRGEKIRVKKFVGRAWSPSLPFSLYFNR